MKSPRVVRIIVVAMLAAVGALLIALSSDQVRWRADVLLRMAAGRIDDLSWLELIRMIRPGSGYYLANLRDGANPFSVIKNPHSSEQDREAGQRLFLTHCVLCHGANGEGGPAPRLVDSTLKMGDADWALFRTITGRSPGLTMPPVALSERETWQVVAHVRALRLSAMHKGVQELPTTDRFPAAFSVTPDRLERSESEPDNWLTYSGSYLSWRYSRLADIKTDNVATLKLAWSLQLDTDESVETSPLVVDGIMFLSEPPSNVLAVDAETGERIWQYRRTVPNDVPACCGRVNRGVAVLGQRVFIGTLDGYLVALDARTGHVEWETKVAEYADGYTMTGAPLAVKDQIVVGVAGGEYGIRGFLDSYDASTGELSWRFQTIPEPGSPGSETWQNDAWKTGGGPTWVTGSYDPALDLIFWGVGNPAPDFNGDVRPGDNLYTNSVIAIKGASGELAWHFQFTPHDEHDWDANQIPVLADLQVEGRMRPLMLWANRNGFYYVLDRATGEFLKAKAFVTQTWAESIDPRGRPVLTPNASPSARGTLIWPGASGGANWWSPSYSPQTQLFYTPLIESPKVFFKRGDEIENHERGELFLGSASVFPGTPSQVGVRALDPTTGELRWERMSPPRTSNAIMGGVLTTAGDVLFMGDLTFFYALDARNGEELWRINLGGSIEAGPTTFAVNGRQHVAIAAGDTLFAFHL